MNVRIITDSASDITPQEADAWGVEVLPITVVFGQEEYLDGVTLTSRAFFEKLVESDALPHTCQITPFQYEQAYRRAAEAGDQVVCVTLSGRLSGGWNSAVMGAGAFAGQVYVVDSENVSIGQRLLVQLAVRLRDQGLPAAEIAAELETQKKRVRLLALLDTLEYLKKGGRISPAVAFAGGVLSIKPVVAVQNGEVALVGKARGSKNGNNLLMQFVERSGGVDFSMPYTLGYSGFSDALLQKYLADSEKLYRDHEGDIPVCCIGSTIGTHAGPGAIGVAFFSRAAQP